MNEMYELLKEKLNSMRNVGADDIAFSFQEVSKMYQLVCFMKQIKEIMDWME